MAEIPVLARLLGQAPVRSLSNALINHPQYWVVGLIAGLWLCGQWSGRWLLFLPATLLLALLVLSWAWPRWQLRLVSVARQLPGALRVGETSHIRFELHSRWPLWQITLLQPLACGNLQDTAPLALPYLRGCQILELAVTPEDCGIFHLSQVELRCAFPFGLWPSTRQLALESQTLWVHPSIIRWHHSPLQQMGRQAAFDSRQGLLWAEHGSDVVGLREYLPSDGPALIDWKSSAKYQQWRVKSFAQDGRPRVLMALDSRPEFSIGLGGRSTRAVQQNLAASLARHCCENGCEVWLVSESGCLKLPAGNRSFGQLDDFLTALPATGSRTGWQLLAEYAYRSQIELMVHWQLSQEPTDIELSILHCRVWNFIMDETSFNQPLLLTKAQSKRRTLHSWDFNVSANSHWELLFHDVV